MSVSAFNQVRTALHEGERPYYTIFIRNALRDRNLRRLRMAVTGERITRSRHNFRLLWAWLLPFTTYFLDIGRGVQLNVLIDMCNGRFPVPQV